MPFLPLFLFYRDDYTLSGLACRDFELFKFNPVQGAFGRYPVHSLPGQILKGISQSFTRIFTKLPTFFSVLWGKYPLKNQIIQITADEFKGFRYVFSIKIDGLAPIIWALNPVTPRRTWEKQVFSRPAPKITHKCDLLHRFAIRPIAFRMKYQSVTPVLAKEPYCGSLR